MTSSQGAPPQLTPPQAVALQPAPLPVARPQAPSPPAAPAQAAIPKEQSSAHWLLAYGLFCLGAGVLAWPWLSGAYTIPWDAKAGAFPQLAFLARSFASGESPFWAPGVFAGHPQIADPQSLIFSPPYLLLALFMREPNFQALDAVAFAMLTLAGLAIIALFRDRGWRAEGALVAAFAFAFGGSNAWRIQHVGEVLSLCWFIIALWLLARALERYSWRYGLAAGIVAGFMVLGRDQIACLCAYLLVIYVLWFLCAGFFFTTLRAESRVLIAGMIGGLAVTLIPLAFTIALAAQSNRPAIDFAGAARGSLPPLSLLTALVANLYGVDGPMADFWGPPSSMVWGANDLVLARNMGTIYFGALPLIALLCIGVARQALWKAEIRYFTFSAVLMGLYAVGSFTPFFRWVYYIPGVDLFRRPADATFPLCAMLAIMAGYCVHAILQTEPIPAPTKDKPVRRSWRPVYEALAGVAFLALAIGGCVFVAWYKGRLVQADWPLKIAGASLLAALLALLLMRLLARRIPALMMVVIAMLMTGDLAINNKPNESTALPSDVYDALRFDTRNPAIALIKKKLAEHAAPDRRDRVELAAVGYEWPNAGLVHGFDHDLGFNPVRLKLFTDATRAGDQIAIPEQRVFSKLYAGFRSPMADLLGVRLVLSSVRLEAMDKTFKESDFTFLGSFASVNVYENPRALPRVLFTTQTRKADFAAMTSDGKWPDVDFRQTVLLETGDSAAPRAPGTVRIVSYGNTQVVIEADSPNGGHVVLNDVFHPWWRADVDGAPAEILRANVMFRAVAVPSGKHRVTFNFTPFSGLWKQTLAAAPGMPKIWGQ